MNLTLLIADDDHSLRGLLADIVKKLGYNCILAKDGEEALTMFYENPNIDLALLDVMMPGMTGYDVCKEIRETSSIPVLMLTALGDESSEVKGLTVGANDYISKPFSYPILVARIEALLRPIKAKKKACIKLDGFELNRDLHKVSIDGKDIDLNHKEYQLLDYLLTNESTVLERYTILEHIWGYDYEGDSSTLTTHIKTLRAKLGTYSSMIKTVKGTGYVVRFDMIRSSHEKC